jgi:dTDP-4-dehydrorhamnose reductase
MAKLSKLIILMNQIKKKILITGGSGLLSVNWALIKKNEYDIILGLHKKIITITGTRSIILNFEDLNILSDTIMELKPEVIIHTAAIANVEICEDNPKLAKLVNTYYSEAIAKISNKLNIKLVHLSTDHLFNGLEEFKSENDPPSPLNIYAQTKLESENMVKLYNNNALIIRTNFFGWGTIYRKSFSDFIIDNLRNQCSIELFNNVFYTPILINELVNITHKLISLDLNGIYNICSNERISKLEFGLILAESFNLDSSLIKSIEIFEKPNLVNRPIDMSLSNKKVKNELSIEIMCLKDQIINLKKDEELFSVNLRNL